MSKVAATTNRHRKHAGSESTWVGLGLGFLVHFRFQCCFAFHSVNGYKEVNLALKLQVLTLKLILIRAPRLKVEALSENSTQTPTKSLAFLVLKLTLNSVLKMSVLQN